MPNGTLGYIPEGTPRNGTTIKEQNETTVYYIDSGQKRPISSSTVLEDRFSGWYYVKVVPDGTLSAMTTGSTVY